MIFINSLSQCSAKGPNWEKMHYNERCIELTNGHGEHWISFVMFKFGRCAHFFGKQLTETHSAHFTVVIGLLAFFKDFLGRL